ncbi:hypothetical protein ERJ75_001179800 [Trypanosoma vivax]|uniref:Uncharacterized protein n=1 Tax=Trypanosoma vivax (strain Y486) TaxID=1055687 RepID=G0UC04_TRYVY|nr:hypothetical protein ERJ75_001179800 [Trypanosoma vivax]CCC53352.1 conserved hypothetical protein [Trypanosoma vivax Y486]
MHGYCGTNGDEAPQLSHDKLWDYNYNLADPASAPAGYCEDHLYGNNQQPCHQPGVVRERQLSQDRLNRGGLNIFSWNMDAPTAAQPRETRTRDQDELQRLRPVDAAVQRDKEVREKFEGNTQSRFLCFSEGDQPPRRQGVRICNPSSGSPLLPQGDGAVGRASNRAPQGRPQPPRVPQEQYQPPPQQFNPQQFVQQQRQEMPAAGRSTYQNGRDSGGIAGFAGMGERRPQNGRRRVAE